MIWREKRWLLLAIGALLALNAVFFLTYRVRYEERVADLNEKLTRAKTERDEARASRVAAERRDASYRNVLRNMEQVYTDLWSTADQRLTPLILEIRQLARTSQVGMPRTISYDQTDVESQSAGDLGASAMVVSFGVEGTYQQIRRLINLIELSKQFMIIDEISFSGASAEKSTIQLSIRLKTLFHEPPLGKRM